MRVCVYVCGGADGVGDASMSVFLLRDLLVDQH